MTASLRCRIAASIVALVAAQLAHAELPQRAPLQILEPGSTDASDDPESPPTSPSQLNWYATFGYRVAVSGSHVVVGAPYQIDEWEPGHVIDYRWSGGSLVAVRLMTSEASHGDGLALNNDTLLTGIPAASGFFGAAAVYKLAAQ